MKGYIDRVWNYRFAYGHGHSHSTKMKLDKVFCIATTGASEDVLTKRKAIEFINHYFNNVIAAYCGIKSSKVKLFHDSFNKELITEEHIPEAYQQGLSFDKW
jgi:putative NADPH-quinone reductase